MDRKEYYRQWRAANRERQRQRQAEYAAANADRIREYQREWRAANADRLRQRNVEYQKREKDRISERSKARYRSNPEPARQRATARYESKRSEIREQAKKYYIDNESAFKRRASERRALIEKVTIGDPKVIEQFYEAVRSSESIRCYWCKKKVPRAERHVDHIVPLSRGGAHATANLCCACKSCNLKKQAKLPEQFSGQGELSLA